MTADSLAAWTFLAFGLWLVMIIAFTGLRLRGATIGAAVLSWLVARAAMSWLPLLFDWINRHLHA
jgi:hypothetical protein